MTHFHNRISKHILGLLVVLFSTNVWSDEFTDADVQRWQQQFMNVVTEGRALWTSPKLGSNGVVCAQCHPNAATPTLKPIQSFKSS